jgi:central kinetochore subunit Mis15/CHL4
MEAALFPDSPTLRRILARHTKDTLISMALRWIDHHPITRIGGNRADEDEDDDYNDSTLDGVDWKAKVRRMSTAQYIKHVKKRYEGLREKSTKKVVVDRILGGDWNTGLNPRQIADLDLAYFSQHATLKSWHVFKLDYGDQGNMNRYWMLPLQIRVVFSLLMASVFNKRPCIVRHSQ